MWWLFLIPLIFVLSIFFIITSVILGVALTVKLAFFIIMIPLKLLEIIIRILFRI
jgi:hypothetical protein